MNEFEKNVQDTRNDAIDSGVGFIVSFGFFALMFIIATVLKLSDPNVMLHNELTEGCTACSLFSF